LRGLPDTEVLLHRPEDIIDKVAEGGIDVGITGLDVLRENREDDEHILMLYEDLGFWGVELIFAAPQSWIDVNTWQDLADLAADFQKQGHPLRIATKFPNLVRRFCYSHGINVFHLIPSAGATEAAPSLGYADIIADITETGTALRENDLKIVGGTILRSQACLIGSKRSLQKNRERLELVRQILELLDARQQGRSAYSLFANIQGASMEDVGRLVADHPQLAGLQGPTISPVWNKHVTGEQQPAWEGWFGVNVIVQQKDLLEAVDHLRRIGASTVTVTPVHYTFYAQSDAYTHLLQVLDE
jgi:ATP phosphoribosyltransferase